MAAGRMRPAAAGALSTPRNPGGGWLDSVPDV